MKRVLKHRSYFGVGGILRTCHLEFVGVAANEGVLDSLLWLSFVFVCGGVCFAAFGFNR